MRVVVILATTSRLAGKLFVERSAQILNGDFLPKGLQGQVTFEAVLYNPAFEADALEDFVVARTAHADAVALLIDVPLVHLAHALHPAIFVGQVDFTSYAMNVQNLLSGQAARLLRNLGLLLTHLADATFFQAAILPLRNFDADELRQLATLCRNSASDGDFGARALALLRLLVARRGPRLRSDYPDRYFQDDVGHYFKYGPEEHARYDTGAPHGIVCNLNGLFRFGKRLEKQRHFNVTDGPNDDDHITAAFHDCHGQRVNIVDRTHVNMFPNDFHK